LSSSFWRSGAKLKLQRRETGMGGQTQQVLIVSGETRHAETLASAVERCGHTLDRCANTEEANSLLARGRYAAVLCEDTVTGGNILSLLSEIGRAAQPTPVIVVSRKDDWEHYLAALSAGAAGYVAFPPYPGELEQSLEKTANLRITMAAVA
jgi:DNA-binding NtrC family response regulator